MALLRLRLTCGIVQLIEPKVRWPCAIVFHTKSEVFEIKLNLSNLSCRNICSYADFLAVKLFSTMWSNPGGGADQG